MTQPRILIAGIGNIFLGDDAFGVAVAQRLARRPLPQQVRVVDFGIRGLDLIYALLENYEIVIMVDALPHGGQPGSLYVLEPDFGDTAGQPQAGTLLEMHRLDPVKVLRLAAEMGAKVERLLLIGCEPETIGTEEDMRDGLSAAVREAVDRAIRLIESLVARLLRGEKFEENQTPIIPSKEASTCPD